MLKNNGGFTLIELIMIIIILGILAAVALPKYQDMATEAKDAVVKGTAGALKSNAIIRFAKNQGAKTDFSTIKNTLDYDTTNITIAGACNATSGSATVSYTNGGATPVTVSLSEYCSANS